MEGGERRRDEGEGWREERGGRRAEGGERRREEEGRRRVEGGEREKGGQRREEELYVCTYVCSSVNKQAYAGKEAWEAPCTGYEL